MDAAPLGGFTVKGLVGEFSSENYNSSTDELWSRSVKS